MDITNRDYSNKVHYFQELLKDGYRRFNKHIINRIESRKEEDYQKKYC